MVLHCWRIFFDCFRKQLLVDVSCGEVRLQPIFRIFVFIVICQAILLLTLVILVVTSVNDNRRVMSEPLELGFALGFN